MSEGRELQVGDEADTDYPGWTVRVRIVERKEDRNCQSGILFRVDPPLREWRDLSNPYDEGGALAWYDADWFTKPKRPAQGVLFL